MTNKKIIVKLGGNILENLENLNCTINQLKQLAYDKNLIQKIIIIPGGGTFANFIRKIDKKLKLGDDLAHWSAIYAMDYNGLELHKRYPDILLINDYDKLLNNLSEPEANLVCVFLPFNYLFKTDKLPHSWDVTSDSITLYLAHKLELNDCYLIKDIDGIFIKGQNQIIREISTRNYEDLKKSNKLKNIGDKFKEFKKSKPLDSHVIKLVDKYKIPCIILNGTRSRVLSYFDKYQNNEGIYTKIRW